MKNRSKSLKSENVLNLPINLFAKKIHLFLQTDCEADKKRFIQVCHGLENRILLGYF